MSTKVSAALMMLSTVLLVGSGCQKTDWQGFYYPNGTNKEFTLKSIERFDSLNACRNWVEQQRQRLNPSLTINDDWECGSNCKLKNAEIDLSICDETIK